MIELCMLLSFLTPPLLFGILKVFGVLAWSWWWVVWFPLLTACCWLAVAVWCMVCMSFRTKSKKRE